MSLREILEGFRRIIHKGFFNFDTIINDFYGLSGIGKGIEEEFFI